MKDFFEKLSQNKNFLMFITSIIYILGLYAFFRQNPLIYCVCISLLFIFLLIKNYFNWKVILFWLFMFYLAYFNASFNMIVNDELYKIAPNKAEITGQIVSIPNVVKKDTLRFFFKVSEINYEGNKVKIPDNKTLVSIEHSKNDKDKLKIGNYYKINGTLSRPFISTNPSQFSYADYLKNYKVCTVFYAKKSEFSKTDKEISLKWKFLQSLNNSRENILKSHSKYLKSPKIEILGGVVFGDDAVAPPDEIRTTFINSGLLHILAASGMNVAFIYGFLYFILRLFKVPFKISVLSGMGIIILYALMTGLGASVIRASIMLIFILLGKLIDRDANSISLLAFVALLMLLYNPMYINDVGFQLSFVVTFGLLLSVNIVLDYFKSIPQWLTGSIFVPLIAQIWVIPIQMFYFNNISIYSVFANIFTVPFLSVISFGGFISSVLALIKPISDFICMVFDFILNPFLNVLIFIAKFFANLPHSLLITTHPSILQVILYYLILILLVYLLKIKFENKKLLATVSIMVLLLILSTINLPNHNLEIISFDVQNGDAFLIKTPENKYIMIDTGKSGYNGSSSKAKMIILKYMRDYGIKNLDYMILTHFDSDHAGGAVDLIENIKIKNIYVNSLSDNSKIAKEIYKKGYNLKSITSDTEILKENDLSVHINKVNIKQNNDNDNSLITILKYNDFSMLFTGDASEKAFYNLKNKLPQNITVLKVPHHGAEGVVNPELMSYLKPKFSLISVGKNKFGHPNPATIRYLKNTKILRTDKNHAIKFVVKKDKYDVYTYNSEKLLFKKY